MVQLSSQALRASKASARGRNFAHCHNGTQRVNLKKWLLNIGEGQYSTKFVRNNSLLKIPHNFLSNRDIITQIFGNKINPVDIFIKNKIILSPTNNNILKMNNEIFS